MYPSDLRKGRRCVFLLHVHLVFVTKYRKPVFVCNHMEVMKRVFEKVCIDFGSILVEMDGAQDHVHLLVNYPPKVALSKLVNSLKGVSSRRLKQQCPELKKCYWKGVLWSPSYFAGSCGGAPLATVKHYISQQSAKN